MGVCNCSMFCCTLLYVHSSIAIILMGKRELIALLNLSSWCLVVVEWLFLAVPRGCLQFVIVVFPDHTHLLLSLLKDTTHWHQWGSNPQPLGLESSTLPLSHCAQVAQGHNTVTPVRPEPAAPRSRVKHSTNEPGYKRDTLLGHIHLGICSATSLKLHSL